MNNTDIPSTHSPESRDSARDSRKKQAAEMRRSSQRSELVQSIRSIFNRIKEENPSEHFQQILTSGTVEEVRNEALDLKRSLDINGKMKRISAKTFACGLAFMQIVEPLLEAKKGVDRLQNELKKYRTSDKRETLSPQEQSTLRNLVMQLRQTLQNYNLLSHQAIQLFSRYNQGKCKDQGEEAALRHSTEFYLQFVDAPQRARIEIQIKEKMGDMPLERRIDALKLFIQTLVQISPSVRDAEVGRCIEMAHQFLGENHLDDAIHELEKALEYAETAEIHLELAACWKSKGDRPQEIASLKKAIQCQPEALDPLLTLAQILEEDGNIPAAIPWYEKVLDLRPDRFSILTHTARLVFEQKQWISAIKWLTRILQQKPKSQKTMVRLGISLIRSGQIERGLSILQECKRRGIEDGQIDCHIGIAFRAQGYHGDARTAFQVAARNLPGDRDVLYWLALSDFENGEYEEGEQHCQLLLSSNDSDLEAVALLARIYNQMGESHKTVDLLASFVDRPDAPTSLLLEYGIGCLNGHRSDDAYSILKKVVEKEERNDVAREALAQACIQSGRFAESSRYMLPTSA